MNALEVALLVDFTHRGFFLGLDLLLFVLGQLDASTFFIAKFQVVRNPEGDTARCHHDSIDVSNDLRDNILIVI